LKRHGGHNARLSLPIKQLVYDDCMHRYAKAVHTDLVDLVEMVVKYEQQHPELSVESKYREKPPSLSCMSAFAASVGLTVQRTTKKKRSVLRATFADEALHAVLNINKWPKGKIRIIDEVHFSAGDAPLYGLGPKNLGAPVEGHLRDKQAWTGVFNVALTEYDPFFYFN